jgi:cytoskeletal protein RodZ
MIRDNWIRRLAECMIESYPQPPSITGWLPEDNARMFSKLLLTLVVTGLVAVYLRKRYQQSKAQKTSSSNNSLPVRSTGNSELDSFLSKARDPSKQSSGTATSSPGNLAVKIKAVLWTVLAVLVVSGGVASYLYWQDQQRLVTVLLHRDASEAPVIYRVSKRNLGDNEFITENGTRVTVSANERMEVVGL